MKLYTEEQIFKYLLEHGTIDLDAFILDMKPIELPSDEEIKEQASMYSNQWQEYRAGAKWMRDKLTNVKEK